MVAAPVEQLLGSITAESGCTDHEIAPWIFPAHRVAPTPRSKRPWGTRRCGAHVEEAKRCERGKDQARSWSVQPDSAVGALEVTEFCLGTRAGAVC